jgi:predicted nucleic-acid-binding Zn-ribbon protein
MSKVFPCPHCRTHNFATRARLRQVKDIPLACWKCGKELIERQIPSEKYIKKSKVKKK